MLTAIQLLHALCWVYWLGADAGTFYAARFVADPQLTPAQRGTAAKIMLGVDLAPRITMPLTLASGLHLASLKLGWPFGVAGAAGVAGPALVWLACAVWLWAVLWLHHAPRNARWATVTRLDFAWRVGLAVALLLLAAAGAAGAAGTAGTGGALLPMPTWLALKLACFALTVACGLAIRIHLKPFGAAFAALMANGATPAVDAQIAQSIARVKPYVYAIWALLIVAAGAGLHLWG